MMDQVQIPWPQNPLPKKRSCPTTDQYVRGLVWINTHEGFQHHEEPLQGIAALERASFFRTTDFLNTDSKKGYIKTRHPQSNTYLVLLQ